MTVVKRDSVEGELHVNAQRAARAARGKAWEVSHVGYHRVKVTVGRWRRPHLVSRAGAVERIRQIRARRVDQTNASRT